MKKKIVLLALILAGCQTTRVMENSSDRMIRERIYEATFEVSGTATRDNLHNEIYTWYTTIRRFGSEDTLYTEFNWLTKEQSVKLIATPIILADTTETKTIAEVVEIEKIKYVIPSWSWIAIIVLLLVCFMLYNLWKYKK